MNYLTAKEIALKWNISSRMVAYYCQAGKISGAVKKGKTWLIPTTAVKPADGRTHKNESQSEMAGNTPYMGETYVDNTYRTGDVSNHFSLTRETLRYYEEIGLIAPKRSDDNNYREFDHFDMMRLLEIDFFRKRGFAPTEIHALQNTAAEDYAAVIQDKIDSIYEKINDLHETIRRLEDIQEFCADMPQQEPQFSIGEMPAYYVEGALTPETFFAEYRERSSDYLDLEREDILSNMVRVVTFNESGYTSSGLYIAKPFYGETRPKQKTFLEGGKCLHVTFAADDDDPLVMERMFGLCMERAKQAALSLRGVVYIFLRFVQLGKRMNRQCYEVWVPVR